MVLVVDIGNTNIVIGGAKFGKIIFKSRIYTDKTLTSDQYSIQIKNILDMNKININQIEGAIISSVVPQILNYFKEAIEKVIKKEVLIVAPGIKTGLNILIDNPAQLGNDLVVNAVASLSILKPPIIIIDMGTATTFSIIDENKNYLGGVIIPGVKISLEALSNKAAQLPFISLNEPKNIIGKNTVESMQSGIIYGTAAMIDGMIEKIQSQMHKKASIIATGGISDHIIPICKSDILYDEELTLKGLFILYKKNLKKLEK